MEKELKKVPLKWIAVASFSKLLDYFITYSVLQFFSFFQESSWSFKLAITILCGFAIEVILLKTCKTTLGLCILGRRFRDNLSLSLSLTVALGAIKQVLKQNRVIHMPSWKLRIGALSLYLIAACSSWACVEGGLPYNASRQYLLPSTLCRDTSSWVEYEAQEIGFKAFFPSTPSIGYKDLGVKHNQKTLGYHEYTSYHENETSYSVCYMEIPKKWKLLGSSTFLKSAINIIVKNVPNAKLARRELTYHGDYPALDFCYHVEGKEVVGRLIVDGVKFFKVSVEYNASLAQDLQKDLFISTFSPVSMED